MIVENKIIIIFIPAANLLLDWEQVFALGLSPIHFVIVNKKDFRNFNSIRKDELQDEMQLVDNSARYNKWQIETVKIVAEVSLNNFKRIYGESSNLKYQ